MSFACLLFLRSSGLEVQGMGTGECWGRCWLGRCDAWQGQAVSSALAAPFAELNDEIAELQRKHLGQVYAAVHRIASKSKKSKKRARVSRPT